MIGKSNKRANPAHVFGTIVSLIGAILLGAGLHPIFNPGRFENWKSNNVCVILTYWGAITLITGIFIYQLPSMFN